MTQVVVFGASGDLTARKLLPALAGNLRAGALERPLQVIGVARRPKADAAWRDELDPWMEPALRPAWERLRPHVHYRAADSLEAGDVVQLGLELDALARDAGHDVRRVGRLFYLALKPDLFAATVRHLSTAGLLDCAPGDPAAWRRVVVEKPFGHDLPSALALNAALREHLREDQILHIDHYLGKETVQNILAFRFQNAIFEPLWSRVHVESVEITVAESIGVPSGRAGYYDTSGALRDMVQNHLLQVLSLVAMEPPSSMSGGDVRDEKVQVLRSLAPFTPEQVARDVVRARYTAGGNIERGYADEAGVAADSSTETYVAIRASIRNWRWNGVPFFLRSGKGLAKRYTEVVLRFRAPPVDLLGGAVDGELCALRPNDLRLLIQPEEGIRLGFLVKQPGPGAIMRPATLGFDYGALTGGADTAPAYQRLLLDAIEGNPTLFIRDDEVEAAWRFVDSIRAGWAAPDAPPLATYAAGSMGPAEADALFRGCEGIWGDGE
ncbi:MAG: glucose-6-phosphate dehydrogenase [Myxococcales bacterium]|nr:glucose-6-phosphate dehydrogenase [Myxococcales bacterium]